LKSPLTFEAKRPLAARCKHLQPPRLLETLQPMLPTAGSEVPGEGVVEYQQLQVGYTRHARASSRDRYYV
jgi:hypothetical protein